MLLGRRLVLLLLLLLLVQLLLLLLLLLPTILLLTLALTLALYVQANSGRDVLSPRGSRRSEGGRLAAEVLR